MNDNDAYNALKEHEISCKRRYGEINVAIKEIKTVGGFNTKLIWLVFAAIVGFELNAIFKIIGH